MDDKLMNKKLIPERLPGQSILLVAVLIVILLGFTALAIDGGALFLTQRQNQNAADAALVASTYVLCTGGDSAAITMAGLLAAQNNDYNNDGTTNTVTINNPPASGTFAGNNEYVEVIVWADAPTNIIQLVFSGATEVTSRAVGHCRIVGAPFDGAAIVSLAGNECRAIETSGSANLTTVFSGIFSNSNQCSGPCSAAYFGGSSSATIDDPGVETVGCIDESGNLTGTQTTGLPPASDPFATIPPPDDACIGAKSSYSDGAGTITPGHYSQIKITGGTHVMQPGIYCIDSGSHNKGIDVTGGQLIGEGVVIYFKSGAVSITGNGNHELLAPSLDSSNPAYCNPATDPFGTCDWAGLLIWVSADNFPYSQSEQKFTGGSGSQFEGTIYAPVNKCTVTGNGSTLALDTQLICYMVEVNGSGDVWIEFEPNDVYQIPPALEVIE
jgi:hypothetical protein